MESGKEYWQVLCDGCVKIQLHVHLHDRCFLLEERNNLEAEFIFPSWI
jgi:hypothetical protein